MKLDLTPYKIENGEEYPLRQNLSEMLRAPGVFSTGNDIVEAVVLAKQIRDSTPGQGDAVGSHILDLDKRETDILRRCLNIHIEATAEGKASFGGPTHEECVLRVFKEDK